MVAFVAVFSSSIKPTTSALSAQMHDRGALALAVQLGDAVGAAAVEVRRPQADGARVVSIVVK